MLDGKTIDALAMQYAARSHHTQLTCTSSRVLAAQGTTKRSGPPRADMAGESPRPRGLRRRRHVARGAGAKRGGASLGYGRVEPVARPAGK